MQVEKIKAVGISSSPVSPVSSLSSLSSSLTIEDCGAIIHRAGTSSYYAIVPKWQGNEAILTVMESGVTTVTDSVGGNAELMRVTGILNLVQVLMFKQYSSRSGTWTTGNPVFGHTGAGGVNSGNVHSRTTSQNAYAEYTLTIPADGVLRIGFYGSAASSTSVEVRISYDNFATSTVVDTFPINTFSGLIKKQWSGVTPGSCKIRVTKKDSGTAGLQVYGPNFFDVTDFDVAPDGVDVNAYGYFRTDANYITNKGACDYAILSQNSNLWAGSYHGGETSQSFSIRIGEVVQSLSSGQFKTGRKLTLEQVTNIDWTGGETAQSHVFHRFGVGGWLLNYCIQGNVLAKRAFTTMTTTLDTFDVVESPISHTFTNTGAKLTLGDVNVCQQYNSTTGQRIVTMWTPTDHEYNSDKAYIQEVVGSYNKLYDAPILNPSGGREFYNHTHSVLRLLY